MLKNTKFRFLPAEKFTLLYILITSILIVIFKGHTHETVNLLEVRIMILLGICFLALIDSFRKIWLFHFFRYAYLAILLSYWYPETFEINKTLPNLDFLLADIEQFLFGCQPALFFAEKFPQHWFSELMNMGYLAYYPLMVIAGFYFYFEDSKYFRFYFFSVIFTFYVYYLIYCISPTVGPQYYFIANGMEDVTNGIFHHLGNYFITNHKLIPFSDHGGFFMNVVQATQMAGERPTAAFPSSHVGISTLIMIHIFKKRYYKVFSFIVPFYLALLASTVYIRAHYVIDVLAGLITAFLFYYLSQWVYNKLFVAKPEELSELTL